MTCLDKWTEYLIMALLSIICSPIHQFIHISYVDVYTHSYTHSPIYSFSPTYPFISPSIHPSCLCGACIFTVSLINPSSRHHAYPFPYVNTTYPTIQSFETTCPCPFIFHYIISPLKKNLSIDPCIHTFIHLSIYPLT